MARCFCASRSRNAARSARRLCHHDRNFYRYSLRAPRAGARLGTRIIRCLSGHSRFVLRFIDERTCSRHRPERPRPARDTGTAAASSRSERRCASRSPAAHRPAPILWTSLGAECVTSVTPALTCLLEARWRVARGIGRPLSRIVRSFRHGPRASFEYPCSIKPRPKIYASSRRSRGMLEISLMAIRACVCAMARTEQISRTGSWRKEACKMRYVWTLATTVRQVPGRDVG